MVENKLEVPFPQANDFDKIITILNIEEEDKLSDKRYLSLLLDMITDRQVQYYLSACAYLGLIDKKKRFTKIAKKLRLMNSSEQIIELARLVISDEIFGTAYFTQKLYNLKLSTEEIVEIMKSKGISYDSEEMYKRRAQSVSGWIGWLEKKIST